MPQSRTYFDCLVQTKDLASVVAYHDTSVYLIDVEHDVKLKSSYQYSPTPVVIRHERTLRIVCPVSLIPTEKWMSPLLFISNGMAY